MTVEFAQDAVEIVSNGDPAAFRRLATTELALALYREGVLPVGRAMELAGLTRRELHGSNAGAGLRLG